MFGSYSMQSDADAEAPSGHTQAGLRPGNVQEPHDRQPDADARLDVVAPPQ